MAVGVSVDVDGCGVSPIGAAAAAAHGRLAMRIMCEADQSGWKCAWYSKA